MSKNSGWFKKLDPGAQFQWERISTAVQPRRSLRGSEAESTTSSQYSSFRGRERSLDPGKFQRATRHSQTNSVSLISLRRPSAFGSDWKRGKVRLVFRLHTASPVKDRPKYASLSASQWLSRSGIPRPRCAYVGCRTVYEPSAFGLPRVIWREIVEAPDDVPLAEEV